MSKITSISLVLASVLSVCRVPAQNSDLQSPKGAQAESQSDLVTYMPPELKLLGPLVGDWKGTMQAYTPTTGKSTSPLSASFHWVLRGYHLEGVLRCTFDKKSYEGHLLWSYDFLAKRYRLYWIDDFSSLSTEYEGALGKDKAFQLTSRLTQGGQTMIQNLRLVVEQAHWEITIRNQDLDGELISSRAYHANR